MKRNELAKSLAERVGRADLLRRACHALRPSDMRPSRLPASRRLRDLTGAARAAAAAGVDDPGAGAALDRQLAELTRQVVATLAEIPLAQLRATLPEVREQSPEEIAALIDLCLESLAAQPLLWGVLEYLITLLASTAKGGRRAVTSDPCALTERLQQSCAAARPPDGNLVELLRGDFVDALDELERTVAIAPVLERLRARKEQNRALLLVPDVLRALVGYNVAIGNRLTTLLGAEKALDDAEIGDPAGDEPGRNAVARSVLAHAGVRALMRGIAARANGIAVESGPVFRIVERLALDRIDARETDLLLAERTTPTDDALLGALVLGLLDERHAQVADALGELDVTPARLVGEWLPLVERELARCIEAALAAGDDRAAQQLAEAKAKFLGHRRSAAQ